MKKHLLSLFFAVFVSLPNIAQQWEPLGANDFNAPASAAGRYLCTANGPNNTIYSAYRDEDNGYRISVKQFIDNEWVYVGSPGFSAAHTNSLFLATDTDYRPYVIFSDNDYTNKATVMHFNGSSWELVGNPGFTSGASYTNSIAIAPDGTIYAAISDSANSYRLTVYQLVNDTWELLGLAGISDASVSNVHMEVDGNSIPYVAYTEALSNYPYHGSVKKFINGAWEYVGAQSFTGLTSYMAFDIDKNDVPFVLTNDSSNNSVPLVFKFDNNMWQTVGSNTVSDNMSGYLAMTISENNVPIVAFQGQASDVTVRQLNNGSWETVGSGSLPFDYAHNKPSITATNDKIFVSQPGDDMMMMGSLATVLQYSDGEWSSTGGNTGIAKGSIQKDALAIDSNGIPYIAFVDYNNDYKISVLSYQNAEWVPVGNEGISVSSATPVTIDIDSNNVPYIFYMDSSVAGRGTVQRYVNGNWEMVGNIGFTTTNGQNLTIALDPNNIPYVVYGYYSGSYRVEVMKFNGSAWEMVGGSSFPEPSSGADLDFNTEGIPYLAYTDINNGYKEAVQRYVNGSWERVGGLGTSAGAAYGINLEFDSNDIPYIAYQDQGNGTKATVKKFSNDAWEVVGTDGFTSGSTVYNTMAISSEDIPYVIYKDYENNGKLSVQRFSNNTWEIVGDAGFSTSPSDWPSIKVSNDGTVYCVYYSNMDKIFAKKFSDNSLPVFTSDEEVSITENETSVMDINATDNDGDMEGNGLSYTFSTKNNEGVDNDLFQLEPITGELSFKEAPNFEVPLDGDMDQTYDVQVAVTDSKGGIATQRILVNITNINEMVLDISTTAAACYDGDSGMATITVDQGNKGYLFELSKNEINIGESISTQDPSYTFEALEAGDYSVLVTDNEGDTVSQSFTIDQPEVLIVNADPSLESYEGANDGRVELTISGGTAPYTYNWSHGETSSTVTGLGNGLYSVTVKDANDCSFDLPVNIELNVPPTILSSASITMDENTEEIIDISVSDTEGETEMNGIFYSFTNDGNGGEDNSIFSLNTDLGIIEFITAPDFESPIDADRDNTYHLQITAEDSYGATSLQNLTVTIMDLQDDVDDYDNDGISDELDTDDDNDGVTDTADAFPMDALEDTDTDGDGIGNNADADDDNDGVTDTADAFPLDASEDTDTDGDGIGNNSDADDDNDGVTDTGDAFPMDASEDTDADGDGIGNNADADDDNDGVTDTGDAFPMDASEDTDADGDGIGNNSDADDDNDGILDFEDAFPTDSNPLVIPAEAFTPNGDGVNDFWLVPGIDNYPNNTVRVYNRSGNTVFEAGSYNNNWAGGYNGNNDKLPAGSYFYVINLGNGQQPVQGWIFINY